MEWILKEMLLRHKNNIYIIGFSAMEYSVFLQKFRGLILSCGKKSLMLKWYNEVLCLIKKKFFNKRNPHVILYQAVNRFIPYVVKGKRKFGKKYSIVPLKIESNRRYVMVLNFLFRILKRKGFIFKVNKFDLLRNIIESMDDRGIGLKNKREYIKFALKGRHLLKDDSKNVNYNKLIVKDKKKRILKLKKREMLDALTDYHFKKKKIFKMDNKYLNF